MIAAGFLPGDCSQVVDKPKSATLTLSPLIWHDARQQLHAIPLGATFILVQTIFENMGILENHLPGYCSKRLVDSQTTGFLTKSTPSTAATSKAIAYRQNHNAHVYWGLPLWRHVMHHNPTIALVRGLIKPASMARLEESNTYESRNLYSMITDFVAGQRLRLCMHMGITGGTLCIPDSSRVF